MNEHDLYAVDSATLKKLRELRRRRSEQACIAGLAVIEHEQRKLGILSKYPSPELEQRLGASYREFLKVTADVMARISALEADDRKIGEHALRELGLDFNKEELSIDHNSGAVLVLRDGAWHPRLREHA